MKHIKRTKLFAVVGKTARCNKCPDCFTEFKHKNVIKGFLNWCFCNKCRKIVPIQMVKKAET